MSRALVLLLLVGACGSFADEDIVVDLRVLAMSASLPQQLVVIDREDPGDPVDLLEQIQPHEMCALIADPEHDRRLRWEMTLCALDSNERCDAGVPSVVIGSGVLDDPDVTVPEPRMCATIQPDGNLLGILLEVLEGDVYGGLAGIDYGIGLRVGAEDESPDLDLYAGKTMSIVPKIPESRTANVNPAVDGIEITIG